MNIINLEEHNELKHLQATVCIIGSGPAGSIVAAQLGEKNIDSIMLEAGNNLPNYSSESISDTTLLSKVADTRFGWTRQYGGSSNLWAGRTHPLESIDFEKRSWIPDSGWPFSLKTLTPYYEQAAEVLNIPGYHYFNSKKGTAREENIFSPLLRQKSGINDKCFQWANKPFKASDYLKERLKNSNLRVYLNAPVGYLEEKADGLSIETAIVIKPDGSIVKVKAKYFILAAGGIEVPRILLNSNQIKQAGIGNEHDTVGRYFSTHPKADMAAIVLNKPVSTVHAMYMDRPLDSGSFRYGIGFSEEKQKKWKLLNHYVQLSPLLEYQANKAFEVIKKTKILNNALIDRNKLVQGFLPGLGKMAYETMGRIARFQPRVQKFILRGFLDQYPDKDNRIKLSQEKKKDGTHKVDIQWRYSQKDKQSVIKFFSHLDLILQENNLGKVEFSTLEKSNDWPLIGIHSHFMGTTRMGENKKTSVTDCDGRVNGSENLYIAGPSLFPTYGFANPFMTITALSLRLGDHLIKKLK